MSAACMLVLLAALAGGVNAQAPVPAPVPAPGPAPGGSLDTFVIESWAPGGSFPAVTLTAPANLTFVWQGVHGVYLIPSSSCPNTFSPTSNGQKEIAAPAVNGDVSVIADTPGSFWYACPVADHCSLGQIVNLKVV